jgi:hypothetical protein
MTSYAELLQSISGITLDEKPSADSATEQDDGFLYDLYAVEEGVPDDLDMDKVTALNWEDHGVFLQDDETWQKEADEEGEEDSNDEDNWQNEYGEEEDESDENFHEYEDRGVSDGEV